MDRKTIEDLERDDRDKLVIDIRSKEDFDKETYPGAINIYWEEFCDHLDQVPKDRPVYLICYTGQRSDEIAGELSEEGYEIYSIDEGFRAYLRMKLHSLLQKEDVMADRCKDVERSIVKKFRKEIWRKFTKAINEYELIQDGDKIVIIEDVTTAGTSIQETLPIVKAQGDVEVLGLVVSVDRMERGQGEKSALTEISEKYGLKTTAIVTMAKVVEHLYNRPYKGKIIIDDEMKAAIDAYYEQYGVK